MSYKPDLGVDKSIINKDLPLEDSSGVQVSQTVGQSERVKIKETKVRKIKSLPPFVKLLFQTSLLAIPLPFPYTLL